MNSYILVGKILQRFKDKGYSKVEGYNSFGYLKESTSSVFVSRENGRDTPIPFEKIKAGIEAYKSDIVLYSKGPVELRKFGIIHITSPVWSLLHLLEPEEYNK